MANAYKDMNSGYANKTVKKPVDGENLEVVDLKSINPNRPLD